MTYPLVVSFWTNPFYRDLSQRLEKSCKVLGLEVVIRERAHQKTIALALQEKAKFLLEMMTETGRPVLWVNACGVILKRPVLFEDPKFSIALYRNGIVYYSGVMYWRPDPEAIRLLKLWIEINQQNPARWDEANLTDLFLREKNVTCFQDLPPEYFFAGDWTTKIHGQIGEVVIDNHVLHVRGMSPGDAPPGIHTEITP